MSKSRLLLIGNFHSASTGTRSVGEELADRLTGAGYSVIKSSPKSRKLTRLLDMITTTLIRRRDYDIAYLEVYSTLAFTWAEICAYLLSAQNKPFVLALHGGGLPDFAVKNPVRIQRLLSRTNFIVTPSLFVQHQLSSLCPGIRYLPNAIDISRYPYRLRETVEPNLIWLRAFHEIYNPEMAVATLAEVIKTYPAATLTMIGPDKHDGSLQRTLKLVEDLGLILKVQVTGAIPKVDVPTELNKGDIFINTTRLESFGVAVMEAAACGLPIVSTDVGELHYLWNDGEDAFLVPSKDHQQMAMGVKKILSEPGLAEKFSRKARKKAEQYDWTDILPKWEVLFDNLMLANTDNKEIK